MKGENLAPFGLDTPRLPQPLHRQSSPPRRNSPPNRLMKIEAR